MSEIGEKCKAGQRRETMKINRLTTALAPALVTYLSPFLVSSSEIVTDVQPSKVRLLTIPAYFVNYKDETTDLAPFLGASISAKVSG